MALVRDPYSNAEAFLAAHPGVRFFDLLLPDLCGVLRGKRIDRADLAGIYERGVFLPGSMFALDMQGGTVQATGLGFDEGDADRACVPVPGTLFPTPWLGEGIAQLQVQMLDERGDELVVGSGKVVGDRHGLSGGGAGIVPAPRG